MAFSRTAYWRRLFSNYILRRGSHLSFWHEEPAVNRDLTADRLGPYYMTFEDKADYAGPFDNAGVPLLPYGGTVGTQYNPIAIAQYGLAAYNRIGEQGDAKWHDILRNQADWLVENLRENDQGVPVWMHDFDFQYGKDGLKAPWYSGLAQGQGVSCLLRGEQALGDKKYGDAADRAFASLTKPIAEGGVLHIDDAGHTWIEEYITEPRSHIVNGFMWASWGVLDHAFARDSTEASRLWDESVKTLVANIHRFDNGYWSMYDLYPGRPRCIASPFYHDLHIVQLEIMDRLTGEAVFKQYADRWRRFRASPFKRRRAVAAKAVFKVLRY